MDTSTYSVSELARRISDAVGAAFPDELWVAGEISGLRRSRAGHVYFDLVESEPGQSHQASSLPVVLFRGYREVVNRQLRHAGITRMDDGMQVRIRAAVSFYERGGRLQLRMSGIDPTHTIGRLAAERDRVLRQLASEGLLGANGRVPLAPVPLTVGLITSNDSAAYHDFLTELERSGFAWTVQLVDTAVQGAAAPAALRDALGVLARRRPSVIAVVRGGGSRTDLAAFDDEQVARTVCALDVPVVTGIGHEVDHSVLDEVAHRAYKTPTACAQGLVARVQDHLTRAEQAWGAIVGRAEVELSRHDRHLRAVAGGIGRTTHGVLRLSDEQLSALAHRLRRATATSLDHQGATLARHQGRLQALAERRLGTADAEVTAAAVVLGRRAPQVLGAAERHVDMLGTQLRLLDPARLLARGWSITRRADGTLVRSVAGLHAGDELATTVHDGQIRAEVTATEARAPHPDPDATGEEPR